MAAPTAPSAAAAVESLLSMCQSRLTAQELVCVAEERTVLMDNKLRSPDIIASLTVEQLRGAGMSLGAAAALKKAFPSAAGTAGTAVPVLEVIRLPYKYYQVQSPSRSTNRRPYPNLQMELWDLEPEWSLMRSYLEDKLSGRTMERVGENGPTILGNEYNANDMFGRCVGEVVQKALRALGYYNLTFTVNPKTETDKGLPDFILSRGAPGTAAVDEVVVGEGKTPAVMLSIVDITRPSKADQPALRSCAEQIGCYMRDRGHRYGFLTYLHATIFIKRKAQDTYAFSLAQECTGTDPSVREMLTYITLKSLEEGPWAGGGQPEAVPGVVPASTLGQSAAQASAAGSSTGRQTRSTTQAAAAAGQQGQQQRYITYPEAALQVSKTILGTGQTGAVYLASFDGVPCAVKMADDFNQKELVHILENEVAAYERLSMLQGSTIPVLHGCGYWRCVFFVATSYIKGVHPGPSMPAALPAAEQALQNIHNLGLVHGDVQPGNILLQQTSDGTYRAWFLDLGHSRAAACQEEYLDELAELRAIFRASDKSDTIGAHLMQE